jgi:hypothetical protein
VEGVKKGRTYKRVKKTVGDNLGYSWAVFLREKIGNFHFSSEERESTMKIIIGRNFFLSL